MGLRFFFRKKRGRRLFSNKIREAGISFDKNQTGRRRLGLKRYFRDEKTRSLRNPDDHGWFEILKKIPKKPEKNPQKSKKKNPDKSPKSPKSKTPYASIGVDQNQMEW